jgi:hypothetical protein
LKIRTRVYAAKILAVMSATIIHATATTDAPLSQYTDRPLSCLSDLDFGCKDSNWDHSPNSGFYTVCCDGNIIDVSGFNSWENYTLLLSNLICCPHEKGDDAGPLEILHCNSVKPTVLSELLATSTEVAQPWTRGANTVQPECFWSQFGEDEMMESTSAPLTTSTIRSTSTVIQVTTVTPTEVAASSTTTASAFSSAALSSEVPASSSNVATSGTTPSPTAVPTGAAVTVHELSRKGMVALSLLILLSLTY